MKRINQLLNPFLEICTLVSTLLLTLTVCIQIFGRFFLENPPAWTEEASRFFFIYAVCFAAALGWKEGYFIGMDYFYEKWSLTIRKFIDLISSWMIIIMLLAFSVYSVQLIILGYAETSPSLNIKMSFSFVSLLIFSLSTCFYTVYHLTNPTTPQE